MGVDGPGHARGPVPLAERAAVPDLARGLMLLLIAVANAHTYLYARPIGVHGYPAAGSTADRALTFTQMIVVDARVYPLFGALVGYGLVHIARRQEEPRVAITVTVRRGVAMIAIGAVHGFLLFSGDIVGAYGLASIVLAVPVALRNRFLLVYATAAGAFLMLLLTAGTGPPDPAATAFSASRAAPTWVGGLGDRAAEWLEVGLVLQFLFVIGAVAAGALLAERTILDAPGRHRPLLRRVAVAGLALSVLGGTPLAGVAAGYWTAPAGFDGALTAVHQISGLAGAAGLLAVIALVADRVGGSGAGRVLRACGQRSLTCYLLQSVVFVIVLAPWAGGLGSQVGVVGASLVGAAAWVVGLAVAALLARAGRRGPAESALRALAYRART